MPLTTAEKLVMLGTPGEVAKEIAAAALAGTSQKPQIIAVTASAAPTAIDLATAQALANDLQTKFNALLAALKA